MSKLTKQPSLAGMTYLCMLTAQTAAALSSALSAAPHRTT